MDFLFSKMEMPQDGQLTNQAHIVTACQPLTAMIPQQMMQIGGMNMQLSGMSAMPVEAMIPTQAVSVAAVPPTRKRKRVKKEDYQSTSYQEQSPGRPPTQKRKRGTCPRNPNRVRREMRRGKSAYMLWLAENRGRFMKPGMSVMDVAKAAGAEWVEMEDKSRWMQMAAQDMKRFEMELERQGAANSLRALQGDGQIT